MATAESVCALGYLGFCTAAIVVALILEIPRRMQKLKIFRIWIQRYPETYYKYFRKEPSGMMFLWPYPWYQNQWESWSVHLEILFGNKYAFDEELARLFRLNRILFGVQVVCMVIILLPAAVF